MELGLEMYNWAKDIFPYNRSITGIGVRQTLNYFKNIFPELCIKGVKSGTKVFDWVVPEEWDISEGFIEDEFGNRIIDIKDNNLHVWSYSVSIDCWLNLAELKERVITIPENKDAIPYITTYYKRTWGFCMSQNQFEKLKKGKYHLVIKSKHFIGELNYGEIILKGKSEKEILISTYVCHPSMANNEISGPVVSLQLAKQLKKNIDRRYTYRILFIPETIGAISYLSINDNYKKLKKNVIAGFQVTCVGDNNNVSFMPSRMQNTLTDRVAIYVLETYVKKYKKYSFLERGSDERQWCSPGIDLPVVSLMRTKYHEYPEYHTSLDNLDYISPKGLKGGYDNILKCIDIIEKNDTYINNCLCEPQLSERGLYPTTSTKDSKHLVKDMMNLITYCDGKHDLMEISEKIGVDFFILYDFAKLLYRKDVISILT